VLTLLGAGGASSSFSPTSVSGLKLWLKADAGLWQDTAGTTAASADADPVGRWDDQSGQGNNVTQATAGKRPLLKLAIQNGRPVIRFDGADDFLSVALTLTPPGHLFFVSNTTGVGQNAAGTIWHGYTGQRNCSWNTGEHQVSEGGAGAFVGTAPSSGVWEVRAVKFNGASSTTRKNGAADRSGDAGSGSAANTVWVGTDESTVRSFVGNIAELLFYSAALSASDEQAVESYLNTSWAIY
jgi:hypothetical protein